MKETMNTSKEKKLSCFLKIIPTFEYQSKKYTTEFHEKFKANTFSYKNHFEKAESKSTKFISLGKLRINSRLKLEVNHVLWV